MSETEVQSDQYCYTINRNLLPVKGIYFTFLSAGGSLLPFIPVYMKQLGLSSAEAGIIYGVMPFVAFFVRPLFGALADKTHKHKLILALCILLTGVCYLMLLFAPSKAIVSTERLVLTGIQCDLFNSYVKDCSPVHSVNTVSNQPMELCQISLTQFGEKFSKCNNSDDICKVDCTLVFASSWLQTCFTNDVIPKMDSDCVDLMPGQAFNFTMNNLSAVIENVILGQNETVHGHVCQNYDLKNVTFSEKNFWQFTCNDTAVFDCHIRCNEVYHGSCKTTSSETFGKTFLIFFIIFLFCNIFFSPVLCLVDSIAYDILRERRGLWGRQRLWGTIGFALHAIVSTFIMDMINRKQNLINYTISFYMFFTLTLLSAVVTYFLKTSPAISCGQVFKNIFSLVKFPKIVVFLIVVTCFGIMNAVIETFLFWYLADLGATQVVFGLCLVFNCVPEAIMFMFTGMIIEKIGHIHCLLLGMLGFAIRFFYYSFLKTAWFVLPVETLHSLTFALMIAAATSYTSIISPSGMTATVQGLVGGLYFGFGKGIGSVVTGQMFDPVSRLGSVWTFRFYGFFAVFLMLLYGIVQYTIFRDLPEEKQSPIVKNKIQTDADTSAAKSLLLGNHMDEVGNTEL